MKSQATQRVAQRQARAIGVITLNDQIRAMAAARLDAALIARETHRSVNYVRRIAGWRLK